MTEAVLFLKNQPLQKRVWLVQKVWKRMLLTYDDE